MANEIAKRDQNYIPVLTGVTDDANQEIRMLRVNPVTGRLLVSGISSGGIMTVTPGGLVNGTNTSFTLADYPQFLVIDGLMKPESGQNGVSYWSWSGGVLTINPDNAPVKSLFAIY